MSSTCLEWIIAKSNKAVVLPDRLRETSALSEGAYQVSIIFSVDGEPKIISRQFIVGKNADDLVWVKPPQSTSRKEGS